MRKHERVFASTGPQRDRGADYDYPRECRDCGRYQGCNREGYCPGCWLIIEEEEKQKDGCAHCGAPPEKQDVGRCWDAEPAPNYCPHCGAYHRPPEVVRTPADNVSDDDIAF